ncbi:type ISP restriction/modification enzyme [Sulfitobacter sp. NAS-14.1]|uniref:type ISP restriction/modification enzyme n=1 Tax=Sulfitobacter TaxID=60136 RepID=UPI000066D38D|nr:type ISP restriction/modification enzyme [Sulfitobacter sp. NAS-14.1]EAP78573.1 adenine specific DNA methyltransferase [Sulfitobacter sp. NAS-14.1]
MNIQGFLAEVSSIYQTGAATEHSYRSALQTLLSSIGEDITALNEPKRVKCGAPDFIVSQGDIVIGHVEAKDIDIGIRGLKGTNKDQQERYRAALPNLIYTNCLEWDFYRDGELLASVRIADFVMGVQPRPQDFESLENLLRDFIAQRPQTITSPRELAERMAGKANLIKDVLFRTLAEDSDVQTELSAQYNAFKENLIHDITPNDFADIYAETIAYGMFAARLHDTTLDTFSRQEALELLPKSNPFLRSLFTYVAGYDLDDRIAWIIDDLARVFRACDVAKIMEGFGKLTGQRDPFLHFYETFLAAYNPAKRKARGVWYTPESVVNFIVRAVDEVLQTEFGLADGLADTSKVVIDWETGEFNKKGKPVTIKKEVHRVQILDPATGTGTFLAEVIKQIAPRVQDIAPAMWSKYIEDDLIPRLHGFELLMASYAMCHMKLDMILTELGYKPAKAPPRLSVYLTNSLEEGEPANQTLPFTQWLSREAKGANTIKRDMPIMCVVGNPPYSIMSGNLTAEQVSLVDAYRSVDGVPIKEKGMLQFEKNINNDYIKFLSLSERLISSNGFGVLGFITSHGYLKSSSFRGLRAHLLETFHDVRVIDLHGNSEIREVSPTGGTDQNVFDIKQGVAIIIAVRRPGDKKKKEKGKAYFAELWGTRKSKYQALEESSVTDIEWTDCEAVAPNYTFHPSGPAFDEYRLKYPSLAEWFPLYSSGVITARDGFSISEDPAQLVKRAKEFSESSDLSNSELCKNLNIKEKKGWDISKARSKLAAESDLDALIEDISYRPFDERKIIYHDSVVWTTARSTMRHMLTDSNIALVSARSEKSGTCSHFFVSDKLVETKCGERTTQSAVFPLFLYPDEQDLDKTRRVNFDNKLWRKLKKLAKHPEHGVPNEVKAFDYIYGVLHCPAYRETYAEFLKIDFPRIPWPTTPDEFWTVAKAGGQLRRLHLMEPAAIGDAPYPFRGEGDNVVDKARFEGGKVWINRTQHFDNAPEVSWDFYIGGYQPAQKWLKDRKSRALSFEDVKHYQRILKILSETDRIMKSIELELPA